MDMDRIMLTYGTINKIKEKIIIDYKENFGSYDIYKTAFQKESYLKKYSKGGEAFPFGMYFENEVSEKAYNSSAGQYVDHNSKYDFEYDLSFVNQIKIITKKKREKSFVVTYNDIIKIFQYEIKPNYSKTYPLIGIGYKFEIDKMDIFVYANSFSGSNDFFFDIEVLTKENGVLKGWVYHLMSNDYSLIYGEDTPNLIYDEYDELIF